MRRDFLKKLPLLGLVALLPEPVQAKSDPDSRIDVLNRVNFRIRYWKYEYTTHSGKVWHIRWTGYKVAQDHSMVSGQWLAYPKTADGKYNGERCYYASTRRLGSAYLGGYEQEKLGYVKGDCFDIVAGPDLYTTPEDELVIICLETQARLLRIIENV